MIYFATSNKNKFDEAKEILSGFSIEIERYEFKHNEIRAESVEEIAIEAVNAAYEELKKPVFVDDTGFFIRSLNGFPGTYAGWAIKKIGKAGILKLMENVEDRSAVFKTCIAYKDKQNLRTFIGKNEGRIATAVAGDSGFAYDQIFIPDGYDRTFAENIALKNKLSHRYKSLSLFSTSLKSTI